MTTTSRTDIAKACFTAYRAKDRAQLESLLSDDFRFVSPYHDGIDKAEYFARCWPASDRVSAHIIEHMVERDSEVFVVYLCTMADGRQFRNTERMTIVGRHVRRVEVYLGASYHDGAFVPRARTPRAPASPPPAAHASDADA
ncbi:MAG: DUF4440 domain-containing protein [Myxococcota bacterium]